MVVSSVAAEVDAIELVEDLTPLNIKHGQIFSKNNVESNYNWDNSSCDVIHNLTYSQDLANWTVNCKITHSSIYKLL